MFNKLFRTIKIFIKNIVKNTKIIMLSYLTKSKKYGNLKHMIGVKFEWYRGEYDEYSLYF